jgi:DNA-binding transcriptional LysR family regulator
LALDWITTLRSFVTAVQQGSLSAAGRLLGYSAASVSRHIASIEEELGTQLLKRSSRKLALTEIGEVYYGQVERVLRDLAEANDVVDQLQTRPTGVLKVHSRMLVGQLVILPHLPDFMAANPEVTIDFMMSNFAAPLMDHDVDVDIRIGKLEDSSLLVRKLITSRRIICAAPHYLASRPPIRTPRDLTAHNCMTYRITLGTPIWRFMNADNEIEEVPVQGNFRTEFGYGLFDLARAGMGVAMLPDWSVRRQLSEGTLVQLLPGYQVTHNEFEDGVYAVYPASRQMSIKLRLFITFLVDLFRREFKQPPRSQKEEAP